MRCLVTKNLCGTDTWEKRDGVFIQCGCLSCQTWLASKDLLEDTNPGTPKAIAQHEPPKHVFRCLECNAPIPNNEPAACCSGVCWDAWEKKNPSPEEE